MIGIPTGKSRKSSKGFFDMLGEKGYTENKL